MTLHYPDLGSASDWLNQISQAARPIRSTTQIWVVTRHQYGISALISQTSFRGEISGGVPKCRLFPQATALVTSIVFKFHIQREQLKSKKKLICTQNSRPRLRLFLRELVFHPSPQVGRKDELP